MGRVFIMNYAGHDLNPAKEYGDEIIYLTEGSLHIFDLDRIRYDLVLALNGNKFNAEEDFLALSGSLILGFLIGEVLTSLEIPKVKLLLWDARNQNYKLRDFTINKKE